MPSPRLHLGNVASHLKRAQALRTAPFTYDLPQGRIALHPHHPRHDSKLLVVPRLSANHCSGATEQASILKFRDLPSLLPPSSLLVRNATRVIPARIPAAKASGGRAEILLLHPLSTDVGVDNMTGSLISNADAAPAALSAPATEQAWAAILGGKSIRVGDLLSASVPHTDTGTSTSRASSPSPILDPNVQQDREEGLTLQARITRRERQYADVLLSSNPTLPLRDVLVKLGLPPLPPYIRRQAQASDRDSFQTTYATHDGSAAAPTAGLHVTATVEQDLAHRQVDVVDVVLHIGTATFRQVEADVTGGHDMHHESISVSGRVVKRLIDQVTQGLPVIALGTTSIRTIESLYWFGVRLLTLAPIGDNSVRYGKGTGAQSAATVDDGLLFVDQWEPYAQMDRFYDNGSQLPSAEDALGAVLDWCDGEEGVVHGGTNLLIVPGYPFRLTNALITNFHQPRSTLLMLVSAFYGGEPDELAKVYRHALENDFRFLSYGDSSIYADAEFFSSANF